MTNYNYPGTYAQQTEYKRRIRERDNFTCQRCGATLADNVQLDVDHIIPFYLSHDSSPSNLRVLCHSCNLIGRRKRAITTLPYDQYFDYIERELAICANS